MEIEGLKKCQLCELYKTRTHVLEGEGDPDAEIMLIAQAPGEQEDQENKMFIGPSGKILNHLLYVSDISRKEIYLTNLIKCHLPKNRRPKQREIIACSRYLEKEIQQVDPKIIVPLGYYSTKYLFAEYGLKEFTKKEYPQLIGQVYHVQNRIIFPLSHPTSLIYHEEFLPENIENYHKLKKMMKNIEIQDKKINKYSID